MWIRCEKIGEYVRIESWKLKVVTVGKLKEKYLKDGIAEYSKRISRFAKLEMIELADEKHQIGPVSQKIKRF